jgi:hypothetical protein
VTGRWTPRTSWDKKRSQRKQRARKGLTKANFLPDPTGPEATLFRDHSNIILLFVRFAQSIESSEPNQPTERARAPAPRVTGGGRALRLARDQQRRRYSACVPRETGRGHGACSDRLGGRKQSSGRASGSGEEKEVEITAPATNRTEEEAWPHAPDKKAARGRGRRHHAASRSRARDPPGNAGGQGQIVAPALPLLAPRRAPTA